MRMHRVVMLVLPCLAVGLASPPARADSAGVVRSATLSNTDGAVVYAHICQGCHMAQGQGASGAGRYPKLAGDPALASATYVAVTVLLGRHDMPAFGQPRQGKAEFWTVQISDAEIAGVVNFVRSHFGNHFRDTVTAAQIAALPHPEGGEEP